MGWKRRERTENSLSCANDLHRTLNLIISRRHLGDDGKEMYQNVNARAERTEPLFLLTKPIVL